MFRVKLVRQALNGWGRTTSVPPDFYLLGQLCFRLVVARLTLLSSGVRDESGRPYPDIFRLRQHLIARRIAPESRRSTGTHGFHDSSR